MLLRLAAAESLNQLGGLAVIQGERWQCGQALGPSSSGGATLLYPLSSTKISYQCIAGNIGKLGPNSHCKVLADINLAVQYGIAIHYLFKSLPNRQN